MKTVNSVIGALIALAGINAVAVDGDFLKAPPSPKKRLPLTVQEAVADILRSLSEQDKETVRSTPREDLIKFHRFWGMGIRNGYELWGSNDKLRASACGSPTCHPEDASQRIIEAVW